MPNNYLPREARPGMAFPHLATNKLRPFWLRLQGALWSAALRHEILTIYTASGYCLFECFHLPICGMDVLGSVHIYQRRAKYSQQYHSICNRHLLLSASTFGGLRTAHQMRRQGLLRIAMASCLGIPFPVLDGFGTAFCG